MQLPVAMPKHAAAMQPSPKSGPMKRLKATPKGSAMKRLMATPKGSAMKRLMATPKRGGMKRLKATPKSGAIKQLKATPKASAVRRPTPKYSVRPGSVVGKPTPKYRARPGDFVQRSTFKRNVTARAAAKKDSLQAAGVTPAPPTTAKPDFGVNPRKFVKKPTPKYSAKADRARLATEYFNRSADPDARPAQECDKQVEDQVVLFSAALLDKAPDTLQSCRSLMLFLNKQLATPAATAPEIVGPQDLRERLQKQADVAGRLAGLASKSWDARAKRIFDIAATIASPEGVALLGTAEKDLQADAPALDRELKERGESSVESLIAGRLKWSQDQVKREWFSWCARLLQQKEAMILAEEDTNNQCGGFGPIEVLQSILGLTSQSS